MLIDRDGWLSATLARPTFTVHLPDDDPEGAVDAVAEHAARHRGAFYFAKLGALDLAGVSALSRAGFMMVEASLGLGRPLADVTIEPETNGPMAVDAFDGRWCEEVLGIAGSCFRYSRFHVDPHFGRALADHVKREWIRSYVERRRGDDLLVAHRDGDALGFAAMLVAPRERGPAAVIDLIGVRPGDQQQGVGRTLVQAAMARYAGRCATVEVGTQASNISSVRLYERSGFRLIRSGLVMHFHADAS